MTCGFGLPGIVSLHVPDPITTSPATSLRDVIGSSFTPGIAPNIPAMPALIAS